MTSETSSILSSIGNFFVNHGLKIAAGIGIAATGVGLAYITGYTLSVTIGSVVLAGAGSIFSPEGGKKTITPRPQLSSNDLAALQQSQSRLPKLDLPISNDQLLITKDGVWAGRQYYSTDALMKLPTFSSILNQPNDGPWGGNRPHCT